MIKKLIPIGVAILTVLSGAIVMFHFVIHYLYPYYVTMEYNKGLKEAASVGIIGSSDGPTSILVTSTDRSYIPAFLVLFIIGIVYLILGKLRKNRKTSLK